MAAAIEFLSIPDEEFDVPEEDLRPDDEPIRPELLEPPSSSGELICSVCGKEIYREPGTRGRKPTMHEECKPEGKRKSDSAPSGHRKTGSSSLNAARDGVIEFGMFVGTMVAFIDKFDGMAIIAGTEDVANSLVQWAEVNPKLRKALEKGGKGVGPMKFAVAVGGIGVPIAAHHDLIPKVMGIPFLGKINKTMQRMKENAASAEDVGL